MFTSIWGFWNKSIPLLLYALFIAGFFTSLIFHKKISAHGVPLVIAAAVFLVPLLFMQKSISYARAWLFLLPLYIGTAISGVTYFARHLERVPQKYHSALFSVLAVLLSLWLTVNKIHTEPYLNNTQMQNINESGEYIEFEYINASVKYYLQFEYAGNKKVLIIFPLSSTTDFWMRRLDKYCGDYFCKDYFIYDLNSYLSNDSRECHRLYVISSETTPELERLLEENGLSVSDYSVPRLMHRFIYANMYKMDRRGNCKGK
jgi:hypothetical protein